MKLDEKDIEIFAIIIRKPGMFLISRVEDYYMFFQGYTFKDRPDIHEFININFSKFVGYKLEMDGSKDNWHRMIRYSSSNDAHSVELFGKLFIEFMNKTYSNFPN